MTIIDIIIFSENPSFVFQSHIHSYMYKVHESAVKSDQNQTFTTLITFFSNNCFRIIVCMILEKYHVMLGQKIWEAPVM